MIWTNPGHELDTIGLKYLKMKNIYLFGFGKQAADMYNFLVWLGLDKEFSISFIWDRTEHETEVVPDTFCGRTVIAYDAQTEAKDIVEDIDYSVIVLNSNLHTRRRDLLFSKGIHNIFYMNPSLTEKENFVQNFVCIYMMYKHNKLLSHWTNFLITSKCNLHCKHCLNFNQYITHACDVPYEDFVRHFDILFSKFDYLYSLHFTGGETQLTKDLCEKIRYINNKYKDRIYDFFIITNGTIVPSDDTLRALKEINGWIFIDDYSESVSISKIPEIINKCEEFQVKCVPVKAESWYDLAIDESNHDHYTDAEMERHKDGCQSYLHEFADGNIYACCYQQYASRVGKVQTEDNDYISIANTPKMEILEFRQGYTKKGYTSLCRHCGGLGENAHVVGVAEQSLVHGRNEK